jgi:hypothetical protein
VGPHRQVLAGLTVVALSIVAAVAISDGGHDSSVRRLLHPHHITPGAASASHTYEVAPPPVQPEAIPPPPLPACSVTEVRRHAVLRTTASGVIGAVTAIGASCHFPLRMAPVGLVAGGRLISRVPLMADPDAINPATDFARSALAVGRISIGFTWTGSWCGVVAQAVRLTFGRTHLDVPLTGPQPACLGQHSNSELIRGAVGDIGQPVQAAPPAWRALTVALSVRPNADDATLRGLRATFSNAGPTAVGLTPIPTYVIGVHDGLGDGTPEEVIAPLPYPADQLVVPAHGRLVLGLPSVTFAADRRYFRTGFPITVTFAIAGVKNATARTTVR